MLDAGKFTVFWSWVKYEEKKLIIAATEDGLCFVGSPNMDDKDLAEWVSRRNPDGVLIRDDEKCEPYVHQLAEYFKGERTSFTIPMDLRGTAFQREVWEALLHIPYGQTRSYSDISSQIGRPSAVRAVGAAIGKNPLLITVPCHRVIAKKGALTGYRGGLDMKEKLLDMEAQLL
ncbi:methylated-DNA--[protein]-cysteine S-methyltransferase [Paenibacillus camelliae]|nr:methylated-DNA--[protein]-cysteine S-methyltransferase [Paenibacillus camelliae]MCM3636041.1 methylated-DNA--[protein]-cysteine S-methyltransferase [Paenibacillus camelliae]